MTEQLQQTKDMAESFLTDQLSKLTDEQKFQLSWVLLGATMADGLIGPPSKSVTPVQTH